MKTLKKLYRSRSNRILAGVLGGIGEYFNIDPTLIRLLFVGGLFLSFGTLSILYIISIFIIPKVWEN